MESRISEQIIRQYLIAHNYTGTLSAFDAESSRTRHKRRFEPYHLVADMRSAISESNLNQLIELWRYLESTFFARLDTDRMRASVSLKVHVFKTYAIHAFSQKRMQKLTELFSKLPTEFSPNSPEWMGWYALPYMSDATELPDFAMYFSKSWWDVLSLSLNNFLCLILTSELASSNPLDRLEQLESEAQSASKFDNKTSGSASAPPPFGKLLDDFNELGSVRAATK